MKLPSNFFHALDNKGWEHLLKIWQDTAARISMEHGIFIEVKVEVIDGNGNTRIAHRNEIIAPHTVARIFFQAFDREFEGLRELKRTLRNKAFL